MNQGLVRFRRLAVTTALASIALTGVGALVRATGSGLGCRDEWPRCHGGWIAPLHYHALIEFSHRTLAAIVVVLLAAMVVSAWRWARPFLWASVAGFATVIAQALLGALVVKSDLHAASVTAHFVVALALVGITTMTAAAAYVHGRPRALDDQARRVWRMSIGALVALLPLLIVGAYVREKGAGLAFGDWPLMAGRLVPGFGTANETIMFVHRLLALLVTGHLVTLALRARKDTRRAVRTLAYTGLALYLSQALIGGANVLSRLNPTAVVAHVTVAYSTWAAFVALVVVSRRVGPSTDANVAGQVHGPGLQDRILAFVALTKPRIITLLLITTVPAMVLAARRLPSLWLVVATLAGGMMTAGSANAFNQYLERDIDEKMSRTRKRPLPTHSVSPKSALIFAIALGIVGFGWLTLTVNLLSALLALSAIAFYVIVYTLLLKRSTPQNIVIGGAAGAVPVLIGWSAVTGTVGAPAWLMFAIVFLWTPPHFWALAMRYRDDYAAAGVPMLPVVRGENSVTLQILLYALVLVAVTLLLSPVGGLGALYAISAVVLGAGFLYRAVRLRWEPSGESAIKLFRYSVTYLGLLFAAIAIDRLLW